MKVLLKLTLLISCLIFSYCQNNDGEQNINNIDTDTAIKIVQNKYSKLPDSTFVNKLNNTTYIVSIFNNGYSDNDVVVLKEEHDSWQELLKMNMFEDILEIQCVMINDIEYIYLKNYSGGNREGTISFVLRALSTNNEYWISFSGEHGYLYDYMEMSSNNLKNNKQIYNFLYEKASTSKDVKLN